MTTPPIEQAPEQSRDVLQCAQCGATYPEAPEACEQCGTPDGFFYPEEA